MSKKREWDWDDAGVSRAYRKTWDELGISPTQFKTFKEASYRHFTTGKKSESDRVWNLLRAGHSLKSLIALADQDIKESSCLFGCLLELTEKKLSNTRGSLQQIRSYLLHLPLSSDERDVLNWMQLLSLDELKLLKDAGFIDDGDDSEFEMVASALEQLRTTIKWLPAALIRLLAELPERFDMDDIASAVQANELRQLASLHIQQSNIERESAEFESGKYGDWRSLGISNDEMYEIVSGYYESSDSMKREVASFYKDGADNRLFMGFKNMLQGSTSARDLLELIRDGLTADDIVGLKDAGLRISKESVAEWSSVESKVILFCIDHGISRDDRGEIFADWMPSGDVVLPWWDYCTKKGWLSKYTKSELLQGISFYDATDDQLTETLDGPHIVELLSLWDYLAWISYSGIKGKFKEIEDWRMRGFMARHRSTPPEFEDLDFSSRSDALAWRYFKFSPKQATDWSRVRLMERLMPGLSPKEAAQWRDAGVKPDEVKTWFDHGISNPSEAASWIATGATPQIAQNRKRAGVNPRAIQD